jgi:hypothetical protein
MAQAAHTDVGIVLELFPAWRQLAHGERRYK